jgi:hypothetical protein
MKTQVETVLRRSILYDLNVASPNNMIEMGGRDVPILVTLAGHFISIILALAATQCSGSRILDFRSLTKKAFFCVFS